MKKDISSELKAIDTFFSLFEAQDLKTEELVQKFREIFFVKPIVIAIAFHLLKNYGDRFSKLHLFWLTALTINLENGDICVKIDENSIKNLFLNRICANFYENDEFIKFYLRDLETKVNKFSEYVIQSTLKELSGSNSPIVSSSFDDITPLFVYDINSENRRLYFRSYFSYENSAASFIREKSHDLTEQSSDEMEFLKKALNILFSENSKKVNWQKVAAASSALSSFSVICGGPGTGKTTTVLKLLMLLLTKDPNHPQQIILCAPTGKAATRMVESIEGQLQPGSEFISTFEKLCSEFHCDKEKLLSMIPRTATTVHKVIGVIPHQERPLYNEDNPLPCNILIVDEVSMLSLSLFSKLIKAVDINTKVILLGDKDQLVSVEPGQVFSDLCSVLNNKDSISKEKLKKLSLITGYTEDSLLQSDGTGHNISENVSMLVESHRFKSSSLLGKLARAVNEAGYENENLIDSWFEKGGFIAVNENEDSLFSDDENAEVTAVFIKDKSRTGLRALSSFITKKSLDFFCGAGEYLSALKSFGFVIRNDDDAKSVFELLNHYRILCANRNGPLGTVEINKKVNADVQSFLRASGKLNLRYDPEDFYPGKVILISRNDPFLNVDNGDVGFVAFDSEEGKKENRLKVFFPPKDRKTGDDSSFTDVRVISPERLSDYGSGFAMTIHKSQGSEYSYVCMVLCAAYNPVLTKELIYTGLTRAKSKDVADKNTNETVTVGGKVSIITDRDLFKECVVKRVYRESGLSVMLKK